MTFHNDDKSLSNYIDSNSQSLTRKNTKTNTGISRNFGHSQTRTHRTLILHARTFRLSQSHVRTTNVPLLEGLAVQISGKIGNIGENFKQEEYWRKEDKN